MNNWMKLGMAGMALAGTLQAAAKEEAPPVPAKSSEATIQINEGSFTIEASDLVAGKLRDYVKQPSTEEMA